MLVIGGSSHLTISSGLVLIQGILVEEDSSTTIEVNNPGVHYGYASLVIEIDLNKENTEEELKQVSYKLLFEQYGSPPLTQENIFENGVGVYQYELARFRTTGIGELSDMQDVRTFIDLSTIFSNTQKTKPILTSDICCIEKEHSSTSSQERKTFNVAYPEGFNKDNTMVVQVLNRYYGYASNDYWNYSDSNYSISAELEENSIQILGIRECEDARIIIAKKTAIPTVKASEV